MSKNDLGVAWMAYLDYDGSLAECPPFIRVYPHRVKWKNATKFSIERGAFYGGVHTMTTKIFPIGDLDTTPEAAAARLQKHLAHEAACARRKARDAEDGAALCAAGRYAVVEP